MGSTADCPHTYVHTQRGKSAWTDTNTDTLDPPTSLSRSISHAICARSLKTKCNVIHHTSSTYLRSAKPDLLPAAPFFLSLEDKHTPGELIPFRSALEPPQFALFPGDGWNDGKWRDRGPSTYIAHLPGWTWWQPPQPRSRPCSSSGLPAPSGCCRCVEFHWRSACLGICQKRCPLSWSTGPKQEDTRSKTQIKRKFLQARHRSSVWFSFNHSTLPDITGSPLWPTPQITNHRLLCF